jgi:guanine deaminase
MCLGAIYWARVERVYFAATSADAAAARFDDSFIYEQIGVEPAARSIPMERLDVAGATAPFSDWLSKSDRTEY